MYAITGKRLKRTSTRARGPQLSTANRLVAAIFGVALHAASAQVGLPVMAISAPSSTAALAPCSAAGTTVVLPAVAFQPVSGLPSGQQNSGENAAVPATGAWLEIDAGVGGLTGGESDTDLSDRVDRLMQSLPLSAPGLRGVLIDLHEPGASEAAYQFELIRIALSAKSVNKRMRVAFVMPDGFDNKHADLVKRLAVYADLVGVDFSADWKHEAAQIEQWSLNKPLVLRERTGLATSGANVLRASLETIGSPVELLWVEAANAGVSNEACESNGLLRTKLPASPVPMPVTSSPMQILVDGKAPVEQWLFGSAQTGDFALISKVAVDAQDKVTLSVQGSTDATYETAWFDPLPADGRASLLPVGGAGLHGYTGEYVLLAMHAKSTSGSAVYNSVDVQGAVDLSAAEIIARWQQYRETQRQQLNHYLATSFMNLHFEATNVVAAFDVSLQIKQYFDRAQPLEEAQSALFVNGVKLDNTYHFPLPQLEPEKVLTKPLELEVNEKYVYKLSGKETIDGAGCYVLSVEPRATGETLYSGKVWIDRTSFREVKQVLSQRSATGNVVETIETQTYGLFPDEAGHVFNLLRSVSAQQTLNAAGRDFLLQRTVQYSGYSINAAGFNEALGAERASDDPMYRETDHGLRSLKKEDGQRVVDETKLTRISSIVGGAMYEGTFNFPIPIAGLTISDFDYRHTGAQLSTFYAGVILATDLSKQFGTRFRLSGDLALNGVPSENRLYSGNIESMGAQVYSWAEDTGARATWLATKHLSLTLDGYVEYDFFHTTSETSSQYVLPRNGLALLPGAQVRMTAKGYTFTADGTRAQRIGWKPFGCAAATLQSDGCGPPAPLEAGYTLYDGDLNKDYYFKKFTKGGWDVAYFGGNQLDRFSRYIPSIFSQPNLHGIPAGTDTFDAIAMGNVHYGLNFMDVIKVDEMYAYAKARNLEESRNFRTFDGLETRVNTPGPFGTLIQSTVSYALDGNLQRYNSRWGALVMIFKPLH